ncbi:family 1 encapsulin nanocompartment shell protein [Polyangium sp. y55x31]|uniref:family 1 encapsulin nanocompartment shell protein n=1 Tax=Polyangium sp. y55x31 TaxID=3042688 RepID=UPI002482D0CA|nr:family 1 encapsulin nanocompartment shell protein [Polyangium sp. y55x31]MDI1477045.1 family 1 encapsulin nanocompartment shell protein [Polyangium sp. y55x31]
MALDLLRRDLAPILPEAFALIDAEARRVLQLSLAARKLVDFRGPFGWGYASVNTGRLRLLGEGPVPGVTIGQRMSQPLLELRTPIVLDLADLDAAARGAVDLDMSAVVQAAERIARVEDGAVFHGYAEGDIPGIVQKSPHPPVRIPAVTAFPAAVVQAKEVLRSAGVTGPYVLVAGSREYDELAAGSDDGYPILKRIERQIIDHPVVWAPALSGAVLLSVRGGDFELTVGQDLSIGYAYHEKQRVELFLTESFTFRVLEPQAAIVLRRG